jgi:DNA-directed RNA polymerase alpha subunit
MRCRICFPDQALAENPLRRAMEGNEPNADAGQAMEGKVNIAEGDPLDPAPELPDDTPIDRVQFPTRIHRALAAAGLKTIGEIRETSNEKLLDLQDLGSGSVSYLREAVGLPSCDGVRSLEKRLR